MSETTSSETLYRRRLEKALKLVAEGKIENWNEAPFIDEYILGFFDVVIDSDHVARSSAISDAERRKVLDVLSAFDALQADFDNNDLWKEMSWEQFEQSDHFRRIRTAARDALSAMNRKP